MKRLLCGLVVLVLAGCAKDEPTPVAVAAQAPPSTPSKQEQALAVAGAKMKLAVARWEQKDYRNTDVEATAALEACPKTQECAELRASAYLLRGGARFQLLLQLYPPRTAIPEAELDRVRSDLREAKRIDPEKTEDADALLKTLEAWLKQTR